MPNIVINSSHAKYIDYTAGFNTTANTIYLGNGRVVMAMNTVLSGNLNKYCIEGYIEYAKVSAQAWIAGDIVYWDNAAGNVTTVSAGNTKIGIAIADAANPSSTGKFYLIPAATI